jgi:L-threonylcarbamoyladenylate synthase
MIRSLMIHSGGDLLLLAGTGDFVFPARATTPRWLTGRFDSLAVRVSDHPLVVELCEAYGKPLVSTSAN